MAKADAKQNPKKDPGSGSGKAGVQDDRQDSRDKPENDTAEIFAGLNRDVFDHKNAAEYMEKYEKGLSKELIISISKDKDEPEWMLEHRLKSYELFMDMPLPKWGPDLSGLDLETITYYAKAGVGEQNNWGEVPPEIKRTFDRLGVPEAEQKVLAGVGAQYESEIIYHNLKKQWEDKGVIFEDMDVALQKHPDLVKKYFMTCVPSHDHKFAALHGAVWSGGTFLYVPKGVHIDAPLQAYFRMNAMAMGQFEHTLIVVDEGAYVEYIEGCSAPKYGKNALHAGCVEVFVKKGARARYSSVENWSKDTYNLNTKRAIVDADAHIEWIGGNFGSGVTMLYPASILKGERASADHIGVAFANDGMVVDSGAKVYHMASHTNSKIVMKSISKDGGVSVYRGLLQVAPGAEDCSSDVQCDALLLDDKSRSDTVPVMKIQNNDVTIAHEATAGKLSEEDIFYLMSRGLNEEEARAMIVSGFIEPLVKELPLEYAVELNRLVELEMEGSIG